MAFTSKGIRDVYHTLSDIFEWISGDKLPEATRLILDFFEGLDGQDPSWSGPRKYPWDPG